MKQDSKPKMPETPSKTINKMLQDRCGKTHNNVVKAGLAYYICGFFQVITTFYNVINPTQEKHSHKAWMVACGVISSLVVLKAYLVYNIIMASAFVMHTLLYYGAFAMGLFGIGLGISGAVFFDKDGGKSSSSSPIRKAPTPPESAKVVPKLVKDYESGNPTPAAPSAPAATEVAPPTSGTHGSPAVPETAEPEEKKDI